MGSSGDDIDAWAETLCRPGETASSVLACHEVCLT